MKKYTKLLVLAFLSILESHPVLSMESEDDKKARFIDHHPAHLRGNEVKGTYAKGKIYVDKDGRKLKMKLHHPEEKEVFERTINMLPNDEIVDGTWQIDGKARWFFNGAGPYEFPFFMRRIAD